MTAIDTGPLYRCVHKFPGVDIKVNIVATSKNASQLLLESKLFQLWNEVDNASFDIIAPHPSQSSIG